MRPKPCRASRIERVALSLGFKFVRQSGAHRVYVHADGRQTVIPFHPGDVAPGTTRAIIRMLGITVERFNEIV